MKRIFVLILTLIVFHSACSKVEEQRKVPSLVFELKKELSGNWNTNGEMLDFRLFDNGNVEFDFLDENKRIKDKPINKTDDLKVRKIAKITKNETEKFINLLTSDDFKSLKNEYKPKRSCLDNFIKNSLDYRYLNQEKHIEIAGHCENLSNPNSENFPGFPTILSELFRKIDKVKAKI